MAEKKDTGKKETKKSASPKKNAPKKGTGKTAAKRSSSKSRKKPTAPAEGQVNVYGLDGTVKGVIDLPDAFSTRYRPDLIRRAVNASRANRRQAYGPGKMAGMRHAVSQWGKGRGSARVQRLTQGRTAAESPPNVGGRRAHPPTPEKDWSQKMNRKERRLALRSALAAVGKPEVVRARGHRLPDGMTTPVVLTGDFETLFNNITDDYKKKKERPAYTKETVSVLRAVGLEMEMRRAKDGIHQRAGRGKMRGRRLKKPKSLLFVVEDVASVRKCVGNLPGVDVVSPRNLSVELLAPGGDPGRLTVFTERSLALIGGEKDA